MQPMDFGHVMRSIMYNINGFIGGRTSTYGVKQGQFEYFLLIFSRPGINQLELSKIKNVGKASVTKALKILESDGFIRRETDPNDRRNIRCYVTDKGVAITEGMLSVKEQVEETLFYGFDEGEKQQLFTYLMRLQKNTEKLHEIVFDEDE